jgi:signal transduction histidine kinase
MLKIRLIFVFTVLFFQNICGQSPTISKLRSELEKHRQIDTVRVNLLIELATAIMRSNNLPLAMQINSEADSLSRVLGYQHGQNLCLRISAQYYWMRGDLPNALDALEQFLLMYDLKDSIRADALYDVSLLWLKKDPKKALEHNRELETLSKELNYRKGQISALKLYANYNWNLSNFDSAFYYEEKSLNLFQDMGNTHMQMESYNNLGVLKRSMGDYPQAMEYYQKAYKIAEMKGDKHAMGSILNNIGSIYQIWNDYAKMFSYYERALKVQKEAGVAFEVSKTYKNIAVAYNSQGNYTKALEYHEKVLEIVSETGSVRDMGYAYSNIGSSYINLNDPGRAEDYLQKALEIGKELGLKALEVQSYNGLAQVRFMQERMNEAYEFSQKAYSLASETGEVELIIRSANILSQSAASIGRYEEAYEYLSMFQTLNDSIQSEENTRRFISLEFQYKYDSEKELTDMALLRQKSIRNYLSGLLAMLVVILILLYVGYWQKQKINHKLSVQQAEIVDKNKELVQLNADKDSFVNILAHDLRGPLGSAVALSEIVINDFRSGENNKIEEYLMLMHQAIEQSSDLLNDLLTWSKSKSGMMPLKPANLVIQDICRRAIFEKELDASRKNISVTCCCDEKAEMSADRNMLEIILRNLISNAIKFTNPGGSIAICSEKRERETIFSVKDTGIGIKQENIDKLWNFADPYTTKGTNNEKGTGFGLLICKELVEKHGGKIWVESIPGNGSEFIFSIPEAKG